MAQTTRAPRLQALEALLLDLDGTLVDTEAIFVKSWQYSAMVHGLSMADNYHLFHEHPLSEEQTVATLFGALPRRTSVAVAEISREYRTRARRHLPLMAGARRLIQTAHSLDLTIILVTNAPPKRVCETFAGVRAAEGIDLERYIDLVISPTSTMRPKPYPDLYRRALEMISPHAAAALAFEDSAIGARAATDSGIPCVHVSKNQHPVVTCSSSLVTCLSSIQDYSIETALKEEK